MSRFGIESPITYCYMLSPLSIVVTTIFFISILTTFVFLFFEQFPNKMWLCHAMPCHTAFDDKYLQIIFQLRDKVDKHCMLHHKLQNFIAKKTPFVFLNDFTHIFACVPKPFFFCYFAFYLGVGVIVITFQQTNQTNTSMRYQCMIFSITQW